MRGWHRAIRKTQAVGWEGSKTLKLVDQSVSFVLQAIWPGEQGSNRSLCWA